MTVRAAGTKQTVGASITLSPATAGPSDSVTVRGTGFGRNERVTLAVNGAALSSVTTRADGTFTATFQAPNGLLSGANSLGASGATSGRSAVTTLTGRLATATTFYFVGASTMPGELARLPLLNPNARPARVDLTFYYNNGARAAHRLVSGRGLHGPHLPRDARRAQSRRDAGAGTTASCCARPTGWASSPSRRSSRRTSARWIAPRARPRSGPTPSSIHGVTSAGPLLRKRAGARMLGRWQD